MNSGRIDVIEIRDIDGIIRTIPVENLATTTIFGMSLKEIAAFRQVYLKYGGALPITVDSINQMWSDRKIDLD